MNRNALLLALLTLILLGALWLTFDAGSDTRLVDLSGRGDRPAEAGASDPGREQDGGKAREGALPAAADPKRSTNERSRLETGLHTDEQGEIFGRVVDALSRPVVGAQVSLFHSMDVDRKGAEARVLTGMETDARGAFRLQDLEWDTFVLRVQAKGFAVESQEVSLSRAIPKIPGIRLILVAGHAVVGRVVDPAGKGIPDAWIVVSSLPRGGLGSEVRSDEKGQFRFAGLRRGPTSILAWAQGHGLGIASLVVDDASQVQVVLPDAAPYRFAFSIAESKGEGIGKPEDVWVRILYEVDNRLQRLPSPVSLLRVPANGEVRTPRLCRGRYHLEPLSSEAIASELWYNEALGPEKPEVKIVVGWQAALPLRGRLSFSDGKPAEGVFLETRVRNRSGMMTAQSDAEGHFVFPKEVCAKGDTWLTIVSKGFLFDHGLQKSVWTTISPGAMERRFTVLRTPVWSGRVVDEKGQLVPFAEVWLHTAGWQDVRFGTTRADENGAFEISLQQARDKPLELDARTADSICTEPLAVSTERESRRQGFVLRLNPASSLEGVVVDKRGVGIPEVQVHAFYGDSAEDALRLSSRGTRRIRKKEWRTARSDSDGRFRIVGMPPGFWRIQVREKGHRRRGADPVVSLGKGEARQGFEIVMSEGLSITGRVLDEAGEAMSGLLVSGKFLGKLAKGEREPTVRSQSGSDGSFALTGLRAGKYELTTQLSRKRQLALGLLQPGPDGGISMLPRNPFVLQVPAGSKGLVWKLVLPRYGGIQARLVQDGLPLERVHVELVSSEPLQTWNYEIPVLQGGLSMKRVLAGRFRLHLHSPRFVDLKLDVQVKPDEVTDLGLLTLVASRQVEGRVEDFTGKPLPGVWIGLDNKLGALWPSYDSTKGIKQFEGRLLAQSDGQGRFRIPIQGQVRVHAFKPGYAPVSLVWPKTPRKKGQGKTPSQELPSAQPLILHLRQAAELAIRAPAPVAGKPATWGARLTRMSDGPLQAGAPVHSHPHPHPPHYLWLQSAKTLHFVGLTPGRYSFEALNFNKSVSYKNVSVQGESYHEVVQIQLGSTRLIKIP